MMKKIKIKREKGRRGEREIFSFLKLSFFFLIGIVILLNFGCQANSTILKDVPPPTPMSTVEQKKTSLEQDLRDMQTANFDYIFVFRRKDGGVFEKDDKKFLRDNTPIETNRWTSTDEGKAYIAGSGFSFSPENLNALKSRFIVENYSKPETDDKANQAANTNKANKNK
jgi:hypothetical protein